MFPSAPQKNAPSPEYIPTLATLFAHVMKQMGGPFTYQGARLVIVDDADMVYSICLKLADGVPEVTHHKRSDFSTALWPEQREGYQVITDLAATLDRTCAVDRQLLDDNSSSIVSTILSGEYDQLGLLVLPSHTPDAIRTSLPEAVAPLVQFLSLTVEREKLWEKEKIRHRRRLALESLVPTLGESLDVRKVFVAMSAKIKEVIPHDVLAFALLSPDRQGVRVQAATHMGVMELPEYRFSNAEEALDANWRFLLAYDLTPIDAESLRVRISPRHSKPAVEAVVKPGPAWMRFVSQAGIHSTLRVPIRRNDRPIGGVAFMSRSADAYDDEDGMLASRITNLVALALAHHEIAQEEQRLAVAEERTNTLQRRVVALSEELERFSAHRAIGTSQPWKSALALAAQVATTETTVLITGESGTGKEVLARYIHRGSNRSEGPFVAINCAAISEHLLESELFGHERGAFTGAVTARAGRIEQAAGGLLFLDEIGEMPPPMQAKLLRVLQEREFQRVGGTKTLKADVRIVAATNRDPRAEIAAGRFREDLYFRLGIFEIHLPPLRERPEDILVLAETFLEEVGRSIGRPAAGISEDARQQLLVHSWPGNVRELRNAIERAVILCQGGLVTREHLPVSTSRFVKASPSDPTIDSTPSSSSNPSLESIKRETVEKAMIKAGHNKSQAAQLLGVSRGQLYSLLRKYGMTLAKR